VARRLVLIPWLVVLVLAGCGGDGSDDGSGDDEKEIRTVIRSSLTTKNPRGDCRQWLSDGLIRRTYGTRQRCVRVQRDDNDQPAKAVAFASVEVNEDAATAEIAVRGGDSDGAKGGLELVREEGAWRIDEISIPLLRSLVEAGLRSGNNVENLPPGALECVGRELNALPDDELREVTYAVIGETSEGQRHILEFFAQCEGEDGRSILRQIFEQGIEESLRESGTSEAQIGCIVQGLRARIPDNSLVALLIEPGAELERLARAAAADCREAQSGPA
jgi:hypothetical protein